MKKEPIVFGIVMLLIIFWTSSCKTETNEKANSSLMCIESGKHSPEDCTECSQIYDQIDNDLKNANYCQTASDCQVLILGGPYIEFGCYHYINKKFDKEEFDSRMIDYFRQCGVMIDECASTPKVACVSGKCVEKEGNDVIEDTVKIIPVKYSDSTEGCIGEGYHLITPSIQEEWETRRDLKCCEGLTAISEAEYPRLFDKDCYPVEGSGELCSNCGNGICEDWESKCSCKEDCTTRVCELGNIEGCDRSCNSDTDCQEVCGAGCISINENFDDKGVDASCPPMWCHCANNICTESS